MSTNLKNAGKLKSFVLSHIEKVVMLLVVAGAGYLVYASTGRETEDKVPSKLRSDITATRGKIDGFTWDNALELADPKPPVAEEFQAKVSETISSVVYKPSRSGLDRSVVPPVVFRKDPTMLTAEAPEANGYTVLMAFYSDANARRIAIREAAEQERKDREREAEREAAGEGRNSGGLGREDDPNTRTVSASIPRGGVSVDENHLVKVQPCVIVTAKVPLQKQVDQYTNTFENALGFDPGRDYPKYLGYFVERAEIRGNAEPKFEPLAFRNGAGGAALRVVSEKTITSAVGDWAEEMEELVDSNYFHPSLTFPLPPRVGSDWGPEVVHSELPLASETEAMRDAMPDESTPDEDPEDSPFLLGDPSSRRGGVGGPGGFGRPGGRTGGGLGGRRPGFGRGRGSFDEGGEMGGGRGGIRGSRNEPVPHAMIRFIDFDAKIGRRYQYRFQLVLLDPNGKGQVSGKYLEKDVRARVRESKQPILKSAWSEPSQIATAPLPGNVSIASVNKPAVGEPTANIVLRSFDIDDSGDAIESSIEKEKLRLGSVLNAVERDAWILTGGMLKKVPQFTYRTGATLLDVDGGEKLNRDMTSPGQALVMDATGRLTVRTEIQDFADVKLYQDIYTEDDNPRGPAGGGSYGGEDFFEF